MEFEGYSYIRYSTRNGIRYLKCAHYGTHFCKGTAKITEDQEFVALHAHNHEPLVDSKIEFQKKLVARAAAETARLREIYDEEALSFPEAATDYTFFSAESAMRKARRRTVPAIPVSVEHLVGMLTTEDRYCCHGNICRGIIEEGSASLVVYCPRLVDDAIQGVTEVHFDGTFKVLPASPPSRQLFIMHVIIQNHIFASGVTVILAAVKKLPAEDIILTAKLAAGILAANFTPVDRGILSIPVLFAMMTQRSRAAYIRLLHYIKTTVMPTLMPAVAITDYERGLQSAIAETWPAVEVKGCYFHYAQAVWRKMRKLGFLRLTSQNPEAKRLLKMSMALPLLPSEDIPRAVDITATHNRSHNLGMERFLNYIRRYWLDTVGSNVMSVFGLPRRTNNNVESFNNILKQKIGVAHPNVYNFLGKLENIIKQGHTSLNQLREGREIRRPRNRYLIDRYKIPTRLYNSGRISLEEFLRRLAHAADNLDNGLRNWANHVQDDDPSSDEGDLYEDLPAVNIRANPGNGAAAAIEVDILDEPPRDQPGLLSDDEERNEELPIVDIDGEEDAENVPDAVVEIIVEADVPDYPPRNEQEDPQDVTRIACSICLNERPLFAFLPCGHLALCTACKERGENLGPLTTCAVCRRLAFEIQRIYY